MKAGIINVTGYAGSELARLLWLHPEVELVSVTGRSAAGKRLPDVLPHLWDIDLQVTESIGNSIDIAFSALPSGASAEVLAPMVESEYALKKFIQCAGQNKKNLHLPFIFFLRIILTRITNRFLNPRFIIEIKVSRVTNLWLNNVVF